MVAQGRNERRDEKNKPRSSSAASESRFVVEEVALAAVLGLLEGTFLEFILSRSSHLGQSIMVVTSSHITVTAQPAAQLDGLSFRLLFRFRI